MQSHLLNIYLISQITYLIMKTDEDILEESLEHLLVLWGLKYIVNYSPLDFYVAWR